MKHKVARIFGFAHLNFVEATNTLMNTNYMYWLAIIIREN